MHSPLYGDYVLVEPSATITHVAKVAEDEGFVDIKAAGNDIFAVLTRQPL